MADGSPVDPVARRIAAQLLRRFIGGRISNDMFEDSEPQTNDRAVRAIWNTMWPFYDDLHEHVLSGKYKLSREDLRLCSRWLMFLHTDQPYVWPDIALAGFDPSQRVQPNVLLRFFSLGALKPEVASAFLAAGDHAYWPFASKADYRTALSAPRLLSGKGSTQRISSFKEGIQ